MADGAYRKTKAQLRERVQIEIADGQRNRIYMTDITVSDFCKNHHRTGTEYTEYLGLNGDGNQDWGRLVERVQEEWGNRKPGYRDGVVIVPISGFGGLFTTPVVNITKDDKFVAVYRSRRAGEVPRLATKVSRINSRGDAREPGVAKFVDVVLYHREVLEEDENRLDELNGSDWEVVTILGKLTDEDQPMTPGTLMANHFGLDGGSDTQMSAEQFETALYASVTFWNGKGMLESLKDLRERLAASAKQFAEADQQLRAATALLEDLRD